MMARRLGQALQSPLSKLTRSEGQKRLGVPLETELTHFIHILEVREGMGGRNLTSTMGRRPETVQCVVQPVLLDRFGRRSKPPIFFFSISKSQLPLHSKPKFDYEAAVAVF
jgi:hypothetical protein